MAETSLQPELALRAHAISDVGCVRHNNEDAHAVVSGLYVLADGMGGHQAGEIASREAVSSFCKFYGQHAHLSDPEQVAALVEESIMAANSHVLHLSRNHAEYGGMGTTLCVLAFHGHSVIIAHVGDSRIYRMRKGKLYPLTSDHSLKRELLDSGCFEEREVEGMSCRHVLTRAIGTDEIVDPTIVIQPVFDNDLYLLCSDGLTDMLTEDEISAILMKAWTVEEKVRALVADAKEHGGHDNVTVILVEAIRKDREYA